MNEVARWLISLGVVIASVGLVVLGMGMSFVRPESSEFNLGLLLMIGGSVAAVVGFVLYRSTQGPDAPPN